jgi:hypothetical protein
MSQVILRVNVHGRDHTDRKPGAGNSFLGGLAAGLSIANGDVYEGLLVYS